MEGTHRRNNLRDGARIDDLVTPTGSDDSPGNPAITADFIRPLR